MQEVKEILKAVCPDLYASELCDNFITQATDSTDESFFGSLYNQAVAYKAAHYYTLFNPDAGAGAGGEIASVTEGRLSISYYHENSQNSGGFWNSSKYGKLYLMLLHSMPRLGVNKKGVGYGVIA